MESVLESIAFEAEQAKKKKIMNVSKLIRHHEGKKLKLYRCTAGKLTIGIGRNIEDNGISDDEAEYLLANDIKECRETLARNLLFWPELCEVRQAVLLDMCFNMGWPRLSGFKNMIAALAVNDFSLAAAEMIDSRWARQVPNRAGCLIKMMTLGQWPKELK